MSFRLRLQHSKKELFLISSIVLLVYGLYFLVDDGRIFLIIVTALGIEKVMENIELDLLRVFLMIVLIQALYFLVDDWKTFIIVLFAIAIEKVLDYVKKYQEIK